MTQSEIAKSLGCTPQTINNWLRARFQPSTHMVKKIIALQLRNPECENLRRLRMAVVSGNPAPAKKVRRYAPRISASTIYRAAGVENRSWLRLSAIPIEYTFVVDRFRDQVAEGKVVPSGCAKRLLNLPNETPTARPLPTEASTVSSRVPAEIQDIPFKVTLQSIAEECGVSTYQVWGWSHGKPVPDKYTGNVMTFLRDLPDNAILPSWGDTLIESLGVKL